MPGEASGCVRGPGFSRRRLRRRIGRRFPDLAQQVAIRMVERLRLIRNDQHRVLLVRPRAIGIDRNRDGVALRPERVLQERIGHDPVRHGTAYRLDTEGARIGPGMADRHRRLPARNRKRLDDSPRRRFPQPVADLIVKRLDLVRLDDPRVVTQPVEQLRPVGLRIDRLQLHALDESLPLGAIGLRIHVDAARAFPYARHAGERAEIGEGVDFWFGFGVDVLGVVLHGWLIGANA